MSAQDRIAASTEPLRDALADILDICEGWTGPMTPAMRVEAIKAVAAKAANATVDKSAASIQHQGDVEALRDSPLYKETAATARPTAELYVTLRMFTPGAEWPRCYYDRSKLCGDRLLDNKPDGYNEYAPENPSWHIAGFCECPSCPVRCAIRDVMPSG